ncbi:putative 2-aminoethylphosphonate ABC transporter permease subunit [Flexibacterium corallicola]|uniref:putative 2-aminoethylphosphonate ABC transporter permease subunit n=1 Tax=Flexibacterium corallicola TaxID=3037259 RepID=UPI00286EE46A|nr:putative 2-aminoethylphosphonate ABC transporter permease subunit [Pseudovibrio sp. M1P-2-3]
MSIATQPASAASSAHGTFASKAKRLNGDNLLMLIALVGISVFLLAFLFAPLYTLLAKAFQTSEGNFAGLANFAEYFQSGSIKTAVYNSVFIAVLVTVISSSLAFGFAYALTRTQMPGKKVFRVLSSIPILAPSLLPAISLIYLFGNQGMINEWLMGHSVYGAIGVTLGLVFYTFPHVLMIMVTALSTADARLYDAARALGAGPVKTFFSVTLPGARYGLISAAFVVFTLTITDFGVPKVIGGQMNVLATDIYKQVVGQQNFSMGAVVGLLLLLPAVVSFSVDRYVRKKQTAQLSAKAVPYQPAKNKRRDTLFFLYCCAISLFLLSILGTALLASLIAYWPYNMSLTLNHYNFNAIDPNGWAAFYNSLKMAGLTSVIGTLVIFLGAFFVEKSVGYQRLRASVQMLAMLPMAVPGMVLGLGYVFFFSNPENPLSMMYGTLTILVVSTVTHFYTVSHLTFSTALKQIDREFELVSASLKVPLYKTMWRVHLPICLPAISEVAIYLFVNAMTTVSAVVFLYSPDTKLASISILNMDDVGDQAPAAAMAMMIVATSAGVKLAHSALMHVLHKRTSAWRHGRSPA